MNLTNQREQSVPAAKREPGVKSLYSRGLKRIVLRATSGPCLPHHMTTQQYNMIWAKKSFLLQFHATVNYILIYCQNENRNLCKMMANVKAVKCHMTSWECCGFICGLAVRIFLKGKWITLVHWQKTALSDLAADWTNQLSITWYHSRTVLSGERRKTWFLLTKTVLCSSFNNETLHLRWKWCYNNFYAKLVSSRGYLQQKMLLPVWR